MPNETNELDGLEFLFDADVAQDFLGGDDEEGTPTPLPNEKITKPEDLDIFETNPNDDDILDDEEEEITPPDPLEDEEEDDENPESQLAGIANYFGKMNLQTKRR